MALPAAHRAPVTARELLRLLAPAPGRAAFALRLALICALTTLATELYGTPEPALTVYVAFFLNKPDRATSVLIDLIFLLLITVVIAFIILMAMVVIDAPMWRVTAIALISFGLLFLTSASKLKPVGPIIALIVGYGLDELGLVPAGELATRALLYAWLFVAIPASISMGVNLLLAPAPRRLAERALARRLELCAAMLRSPTPRTRDAFAESLSEGPGEIPAWLQVAGLERTSPPTDVAALRQATDSTIAIQLLVDLVMRVPEPLLPPAARERVASLLSEMAAVLRRKAYPVEIALPPLDGEAALPEPSREVAANLRQTLADFTEPAPPTPRPTKTSGGFFLPDAFTNPEHVQFALKTTAAAMFCYGFYTLLDWPNIHTCFITVYIVALSTTAEAAEKQTLRVLGCLIGAAAGIAAIVYVVPHLATVGALMALVFAGALAAAWVAVGSPRIAYAGFQIAFAFFLCVLQGSAPAFDMVTARDRVIGILIGNLVCWVISVVLWPVSIANRIDPALRALAQTLSDMVSAAGARARRGLAAKALAEYGAVERDLELVAYEPKEIRPEQAWVESRQQAAKGAAALIGPLLSSGQRSSGLAVLERAIARDAGVERMADHAPA